MYDAIVVGGGVVGLATAYHLLRGGARTLLVDRADRGRATDAGAGIITADTNARDAPARFEFAVRAAAYYPALLEGLRQDGAGDTGYARCGMLVVAVSPDEREAFARSREAIPGRRGAQWAPDGNELFAVTADDAQRMFPPLAPVLGALYHRGAARVDGRLLARALRTAAGGRGLAVMQGSVDRLIVEDRRIAGVIVGGERVSSTRVAIAGGAWSQAFGDQLGISIPVRPQRGQILHLRAAGVLTEGWPIVSAYRGHYLVPWADGRVVAGATRESGSGFDARLTAAGVREVLAEAVRVAPGLGDWEIHEMRVGLRPLSDDGLPVLGAVPGIEGAYLATGHGPAGLHLGPYSGKVVAGVMLGSAPEIDLTPFEVERFRRR